MKNVLVIAFQLHYSAGSECAVAMDFARNMGKHHHITMIYGACQQFHKIGDTSEMESWTASNKVENVKFIPFRPSFKSNEYGYSMIGNLLFYREYRRWHKELRDFIHELIDKEQFDLIHYLGPIGYHEPGYLETIGIPVVWGPIGGFETVNLKLTKPSLSYKNFFNTVLKNISNKIQYRLDYRVRYSLKNTDVVIFAVSRYIDIVNSVIGHKHKSRFLYLPENCISNVQLLNEAKFDNKIINLVYIGRLDEKKGLHFILDALKNVQNISSIKLHVLGTGPLEEKFKNMAKDRISDIVEWHGNVSRQEVQNYLNDSHLMVIPSILDANTTVVWESMAVGVPVLAFDHCGFHDTIIDRKTGFLIQPKNYCNAVKDITGIFNEIIEKPQILKELALNVLCHRNKYSWDSRSKFFNDLYKSVTTDVCQE